MSIETPDFTILLGEAFIADLQSAGETVTDALRRVEKDHPGYGYTYSTEIRCDAWACSEYMEVEAGRKNSAEEAYAAHRARHVDTLLALWAEKAGATGESPRGGV